MKQQTNKTERYNTFCPVFPGFYGTLFEYEREVEDIEQYNEENKTDFDYEDFEWDYRDYSNRVSKAFVNKLEAEISDVLPVKLEFQEVISPREYNFYNDSINIVAELNLNELLKFIRNNKKQAAQYFKDKYTSCSGFISSHSNNVDTWLNKVYIFEYPEHRIGALLDCLCYIVGITDEDIYDYCSSEFYVDFSHKEDKETQVFN